VKEIKKELNYIAVDIAYSTIMKKTKVQVTKLKIQGIG
jgi:hypothetical protein